MLAAAVDATRLGVQSPLHPDLLRAAAPGYCTPQQQAEAQPNWFEQVIGYATERLRGAAAALEPVGAGMGELVGYTVGDYLLQHASSNVTTSESYPAPGRPSFSTLKTRTTSAGWHR